MIWHDVALLKKEIRASTAEIEKLYGKIHSVELKLCDLLDILESRVSELESQAPNEILRRKPPVKLTKTKTWTELRKAVEGKEDFQPNAQGF